MVKPSLSSVQGSVWKDFNKDGIKNANESALKGVSVFLDLNNDGVLDAEEPKAVTDINGTYKFKDVLTGLYTIRVATDDNDTVTFPKNYTPNIPFTGLEANNQGLAAWNTDGSGTEPAKIGHQTVFYGSAYYYLASPSYGGINPKSTASIQAEKSITGFSNLKKALTDTDYSPNDIKVNLGLVSLGSDILGKDWFSIGNKEIRYYTGEDIFIKIGGESIIRAPLEKFTLVIDYNISNPLLDEISGWVDIGPLQNISDKSSSKAKTVANALLKDINDKDITFTFDFFQPAAQFDFIGKGRYGAFYEAKKVNLTFADGAIVTDSAYKLVVDPGEVFSNINFGL